MAAGIPRIVTVMLLCCMLAFSGGCGRKGNIDGGDAPQVRATEAPAAIEIPLASPSAPLQKAAAPPEEKLMQDLVLETKPVYGPPEAVKIAYLTFDDGPSGQTENILKLLAKHGVKATFFVTGKDSEASKTLYKRIADEGHRFGNHTYSHDYTKLYRNSNEFLEDVRKLDRFLRDTVGQGTDILRFPGGSNTRLGRRKGQAWIMPELVKRVKAEGYQYFDWNVTSTDAAQAVQPKADIVSSVLSLAKGKDRIIVLMHDVTGKTTTVEALPEVIRGLKQQGFRFETLTKGSFTTQFLK
jgi:peptidoglycan-N-acetylglucosamine deacetylase